MLNTYVLRDIEKDIHDFLFGALVDDCAWSGPRIECIYNRYMLRCDGSNLVFQDDTSLVIYDEKVFYAFKPRVTIKTSSPRYCLVVPYERHVIDKTRDRLFVLFSHHNPIFVDEYDLRDTSYISKSAQLPDCIDICFLTLSIVCFLENNYNVISIFNFVKQQYICRIQLKARITHCYHLFVDRTEQLLFIVIDDSTILTYSFVL
jgi:hypothetical protein